MAESTNIADVPLPCRVAECVHTFLCAHVVYVYLVRGVGDPAFYHNNEWQVGALRFIVLRGDHPYFQESVGRPMPLLTRKYG